MTGASPDTEFQQWTVDQINALRYLHKLPKVQYPPPIPETLSGNPQGVGPGGGGGINPMGNQS